MIYTGLESYTDAELVAMIERQGNPLAHELLRRSADAAEDIEYYKRQIDDLQEELERAEEASGIGELKTKLQLADDRANDFERKAQKFERDNKRMQDNFNKFKVAYEARIAKLESQIADAPATW